MATAQAQATATAEAIPATQDSETPAEQPAEAVETAEAERRMYHSYYELIAPDMTLAAMNQAERGYIQELAQHGDLEALKVVFRTMLADPERGKRMLDLPGHVRHAMIAATCGEQNALTRESFLAKADMVEANMLQEASASPLERLLIERVVTCWLAAELADMDASQQDREMSLPMLSANIAGRATVAGYFAKRQERAHKRFLAAVDALGRIRRLASPLPLAAAQVNIAAPGAQQVNLAAVDPRG